MGIYKAFILSIKTRRECKTYAPCSAVVNLLLKQHTIGISASATEVFQSKTPLEINGFDSKAQCLGTS